MIVLLIYGTFLFSFSYLYIRSNLSYDCLFICVILFIALFLFCFSLPCIFFLSPSRVLFSRSRFPSAGGHTSIITGKQSHGKIPFLKKSILHIPGVCLARSGRVISRTSACSIAILPAFRPQMKMGRRKLFILRGDCGSN